MTGIRSCDRHDIAAMVDMMRNYSKHSPIESLQHNHNPLWVTKLFTEIVYGGGYSWIAYRDNRPAGMLVAIKNTNIWNPDIKTVNELCWWVEPQFRNTFVGYRLLEAYRNRCEELLSTGEISYWTISRMANSPDIDYTRLGCRELEQTYFNE